MAYSGVFDVDKDLAGAGLRDGNFLVLDGSSDLLDDLRPLLLWDLSRHVVWIIKLKLLVGLGLV